MPDQWPPKASEGQKSTKDKQIKTLTALQGHVSRARSNLSLTLTQEGASIESVTHAIENLEHKLQTFTDKQLDVVILYADDGQVLVLEERVNSVISDADSILRQAVGKKSKITTTSTSEVSRAPRKITFRPLDNDNVRLWMRQVEDLSILWQYQHN